MNVSLLLFTLATLLAFPIANRSDAASKYYGIRVPDPYRWMERVNDPETRRWALATDALSRSYLYTLPLRAQFRSRIARLWSYRRDGLVEVYGRVEVKHIRKVAIAQLRGRAPLPILDTATAGVVADSLTFSRDGHFAAYATVAKPSTDIAWHVVDIFARKTLADRVIAPSGSLVSWGARGFFYSTSRTLDAAHTLLQLRYHALEQPASNDLTAFDLHGGPYALESTNASQDGAWLVISITDAFYRTRVFLRQMSSGGLASYEPFKNAPASYAYVGDIDGRLYFTSSRSCDNHCIISIDPDGRQAPKTVVAEAPFAIDGATVVGEHLFVLYDRAARSHIVEFDVHGNSLRELALPEPGSVDPLSLTDDGRGRLLVRFESYIDPPETLSFSPNDGNRSIVSRTYVNYNPRDFVTEQRFFNSRDGTIVPLSISYRRGIHLNGKNPTILYTYAGFGIAEMPVWTPEIVSWLSAGGIYAVVGARGGGEYGEEWHRAGSVLRKHVSIDDTIDAAFELGYAGYADSSHLAVRGDSNGGFIAAAAVLERPDVFAALITREGNLDLVRSAEMLGGHYWDSEYGSTSGGEAQFRNILRLSPLASIRSNATYPAMLIQTGDADDVVSPAHAYKFVATLHENAERANIVLLRVDHGVGHHGGEALTAVINESVDQYSFLFNAMQIHKVHDL